MLSTITADVALATAVHALAHLQRRPPDRAFLHAQASLAEAALAAFGAALAHPLAEIDAQVRDGYLAALVLACTLAAMPAEVTSFTRTAARMLDLLEPLASTWCRELRARLVPATRAGEPSVTGRARA